VQYIIYTGVQAIEVSLQSYARKYRITGNT